MAESHEHKGSKKEETLHVNPSQVKVEHTGHITITDPKVAQLLQQKAGVERGATLRADEVSVGVVVSKSF